MEPSRIPESITPWGASTIMIKKTTVEFIYEWPKIPPIMLTARMSPFRNYESPRTTGIHHTMGASTITIITNGQKELSSYKPHGTSPFPDYKISTDYRNPSYHGSLHNYDQKIKIKKLHHIDHRTESDESNESYIIHNERGTGNATMKGK